MRLSVTEIDQLRYFRDSEYMELGELIARFKEKVETTEMIVGKAFHEVLENAGESELDTVKHDGLTFHFELDQELPLPDIRELKAEKEYNIEGLTVTLVGKVDAISGITIYDHKLSKSIDVEKYIPSLQWRCYLDIFGSKKFTYNVFQGSIREPDIFVRDFAQFTFYSYPNLKNDVYLGIKDFIDFARNHLPERFNGN